MRIDIITLFPNMFDGFLNESIIKRAIQNNYVEVNIINLRDYTLDKHNKVDDTPFGGGAGMVIAPQPVFSCIEEIKTKKSKVFLTSPQGSTLSQKKAYELTSEEHIIILCGHYEGFDERCMTLVDEEISIGDYVLTGGELAAMVISDSVIRLLDGVITKESHENDSFSNGLLEHPQYTKPREFRGLEVPEVLLSGHHKKIDEWRHKESLRKTYLKRKDLLENREFTKQELKWMEEFLDETRLKDQ